MSCRYILQHRIYTFLSIQYLLKHGTYIYTIKKHDIYILTIEHILYVIQLSDRVYNVTFPA
jgi:hypothetical protein